MKTVHLPIDSISIDGGTQAREIINMTTVAEYAAAMEEGEALPPGVVFFDGTKHHLGDGFHRFHAHRKIGATTFECEVRTGTLLDAKLYAYGANKAHGLQRTNADKRKAVLGMLADFSDWSDRAIARHVGVGHTLVADTRKGHLAENPDAPATRTVERAGKTYTQDTSGQKKANKDRAEKKAKPAAPALAAVASCSPAPAAESARDEVPPKSEQATADPRDERIADLERIAAEINADNASMAEVFDADDKLAAAMAEIARLNRENAQLKSLADKLHERINGLVNQSTQQIQRIKAMQAKMKKAGLE